MDIYEQKLIEIKSTIDRIIRVVSTYKEEVENTKSQVKYLKTNMNDLMKNYKKKDYHMKKELEQSISITKR